MVRIQAEDFSLTEEIAALQNIIGANTGGIVSFIGTVRNSSSHGTVHALVIEHYPGMTEIELTKIAQHAQQQFQILAVRIVHRIGYLNAGENIVLILVAAQHRNTAFDACRFVIDQLKRSVPLWKKEITASGEYWIEDETPKINWSGLRVGILTLSDTRRRESDASGDILEKQIRDNGAEIAIRELLPDDSAQIQELLTKWSDELRLDLILTTGGTGPGPRDITPEATRAITGRELPGIGELMRRAGLSQTRNAALSRGIAALRGTTLIINLPGSPNGALQNLQSVADLIPHILHMARGAGH